MLRSEARATGQSKHRLVVARSNFGLTCQSKILAQNCRWDVDGAAWDRIQRLDLPAGNTQERELLACEARKKARLFLQPLETKCSEITGRGCRWKKRVKQDRPFLLCLGEAMRHDMRR
jgi:hypothetical protein